MIPATSTAAASTRTGLSYLWVAVGSSGGLSTSTSTTASTWTTQTSSFGGTNIQGVASNGVDLYVAVGQAGKLATSPDGTTWTQRTSSFGADDINSVAYGNGYWVAVGAVAKVAYSTDGINWTQKTTGITGTGFAVSWGNGTWVISNSNGSFYTATDPTGTWTARTSTLSAVSLHGIFYWKTMGIWIAGTEAGTTGALASSTDAATWTARNSTYTPFSTTNVGFTANTTVAVIGATIAITPTCDVQSSTDGITWTNRTPATTTASIATAASDSSGFILCLGTKIQTTTDGITYTDRGVYSGPQNCVCHSSGMPSIR